MADYIRINTWPPDHATTAYEGGHYIEALQVLHGWLESRLQQILLLQRAKLNLPHQEGSFGRAWEVSYELSLNNIAKALFVGGLISEDLLNMLVRFNRVRNAVIHKMFLEPHDKQYLGVPRKEYDDAFQLGLELCELLEGMEYDLVS